MVGRAVRTVPRQREYGPYIEQMGHLMSFIVFDVLATHVDYFEASEDKKSMLRICNFDKFLIEEKNKWTNDEISTTDIMDEVKGKRGHIFDKCQEVPFAQLLYLARINGKVRCSSYDIKKALQAGYCLMMYWTDKVLQEHYRLNKAQRIDFLYWFNDRIDSFRRGYQTIDGVCELYRDEFNFDLKEGVPLKE